MSRRKWIILGCVVVTALIVAGVVVVVQLSQVARPYGLVVNPPLPTSDFTLTFDG
jgi:hypothetical protein